MVNEIWMPIKGYEGLYEVSNMGRVKSLKRLRTKERILAYFVNKQGYKRVNLWKNNKCKKYSIHRLVACAFIEKPDGKNTVNHIDENKQNNCADNLEWVTDVENHNHGTINKRISKSLTNNLQRSKPVYQLNDELEIIGEYPSVYEASRVTGINVSSIRDVLHCRNKHAGGYIWLFK